MKDYFDNITEFEENKVKVDIEKQSYTLNIPSLGGIEKKKALRIAQEHAVELIANKLGDQIEKAFIKKNKKKIESYIEKRIEEYKDDLFKHIFYKVENINRY